MGRRVSAIVFGAATVAHRGPETGESFFPRTASVRRDFGIAALAIDGLASIAAVRAIGAAVTAVAAAVALLAAQARRVYAIDHATATARADLLLLCS